ncbi:MAG TPA: hypothetical protein VNF68_01840 [Candidatus Baltobacteraceae bacterium]|nr:hypothetical protein [Candidatus Baltobacteraceae bacterium]
MKRTFFLIHAGLVGAALIATMGCSSASQDPAKTARFETFFQTVLADKVPTANLSDAMKQGLTPTAVSQIRAGYASLGTFEKLQYLGEDTAQGYQRYHYAAIFSKGKQAVMFVLDSNGDLAGFFNE